jgi:hypothetical protein
MRLIMKDSNQLSRRRYLALMSAAMALGGEQAPAASSDDDREQRMKWWHEARFGMFVHWGLYSAVGRHEWVMENEATPVAEYEELAKPFHTAAQCCAGLGEAGAPSRPEVYGHDH